MIIKPLTLFSILLLGGCMLPEGNGDYRAGRYLGFTTTQATADWRKANGISRDALVAIYPDGQYAIVEDPTRLRYAPQSLDTYVNDFVDCYVDMDGVYLAQPVILQAPCDRDPDRWGFH